MSDLLNGKSMISVIETHLVRNSNTNISVIKSYLLVKLRHLLNLILQDSNWYEIVFFFMSLTMLTLQCSIQAVEVQNYIP